MNDPSSYCRSVEAYLCRKNAGHLIRIVGPAFEQVCGWSTRGIPLNAVYQGIDRWLSERYYAKGTRRRPVRVEFCEADILDVFDEWRRAVGIAMTALPERSKEPETAGAGADASSDAKRKTGSLPEHIDRVIARLTGLRASGGLSSDGASGFSRIVAETIRELDAGRATSRGLRGDARRLFLERLRALDARLLEAAHGACDPSTVAELLADADTELLPFKDRLPQDQYERARQACADRLLRERFRLPVTAFE